MSDNTTTAVLAVVLLIGSVVVAGATVAATYAYFSDTETASASISAATDFGGGTPPDGTVAWNDADGDGQYDEGEQTYDNSDFTQNGNGNINYPNENITTTEDLPITLNGNGNIDLSNAKIKSDKSIYIQSNGGDIDLTNAELIAENQIVLTANGGGIISLAGATCSPEAYINGQTSGQTECN